MIIKLTFKPRNSKTVQH